MDGSALELLRVLLEIHAGVGALPRTRGPRDIEYLSLLRDVGYALELAVVGYLELSELLYEPLCSSSSALLAQWSDTLTIIPLYLPPSILARGRATLLRLSLILNIRQINV